MESLTHDLHWALHTVRTHERAGDGETRHVVDVRVSVERWLSVSGRRGTVNEANRTKKVRLTFNYWRKGGYNIGSEDYRWGVIKAKLPGPVFFALNVTFISFSQNV